MPRRKLPQTDAERNAALRNAKDRKDFIPAPLVIPFMPATIIRLDTFQPVYKTKYNAVNAAKNAQTTLTLNVGEARKLAIFIEWDFVDALNRAIRRNLFLKTVRNLYNIDVDNNNQPAITTENDIRDWGENINEGETARVAAGGAPITFPSLADVNAFVNNFNTLNQQQANAKEVYDMAQEELELENVEADKLILKLWNEIETAFDEGDKPSMRRKARDWGVVYLPSPGEKISPDEFSITGKAADAVTAAPVSEVNVTLLENGTIVLSQPNGDYFVGTQPVGTYTLLAEKPGFFPLTLPGVPVSAGAVTVRNIPMVSVANSGVTVVTEGDYNTEIVTVDFTGVVPTPTSIVTVEITGSAAGIFATDDPAGVPAGTLYERPEGSTITLLVDDLMTLIGAGPANQIVRVQNMGVAAGHYKFTFRNLEA